MVIMQGKLIAIVFTPRIVHIETSFLWAEFVNKNDASVFSLYSRRIKALNFDNFDNSHNSFLWPEYFIDFLCVRWIHVRLRHPSLCLHYWPVQFYVCDNFRMKCLSINQYLLVYFGNLKINWNTNKLPASK